MSGFLLGNVTQSQSKKEIFYPPLVFLQELYLFCGIGFEVWTIGQRGGVF